MFTTHSLHLACVHIIQRHFDNHPKVLNNAQELTGGEGTRFWIFFQNL